MSKLAKSSGGVEARTMPGRVVPQTLADGLPQAGALASDLFRSNRHAWVTHSRRGRERGDPVASYRHLHHSVTLQLLAGAPLVHRQFPDLDQPGADHIAAQAQQLSGVHLVVMTEAIGGAQ